MCPTDYPQNAPCELWPDNVPAFNVFVAMLTQWRTAGIDGEGTIIRTGLDYSALPEVWRRCKIASADRGEVFDDLRVLEDAALDKMRENRANRT